MFGFEFRCHNVSLVHNQWGQKKHQIQQSLTYKQSPPLLKIFFVIYKGNGGSDAKVTSTHNGAITIISQSLSAHKTNERK
jgi:hypothetical protein